MRIRRVTVHYDRVTVSHLQWRSAHRLSPDEQAALAKDFYKMVSLPLPWFSSQFAVVHARIIAAFFDEQQVWFDGQIVA